MAIRDGTGLGGGSGVGVAEVSPYGTSSSGVGFAAPPVGTPHPATRASRPAVTQRPAFTGHTRARRG